MQGELQLENFSGSSKLHFGLNVSRHFKKSTLQYSLFVSGYWETFRMVCTEQEFMLTYSRGKKYTSGNGKVLPMGTILWGSNTAEVQH